MSDLRLCAPTKKDVLDCTKCIKQHEIFFSNKQSLSFHRKNQAQMTIISDMLDHETQD